MSATIRAAWQREFTLSKKQRKSLAEILRRRKPDQVDHFLDEIQVHFSTLRWAWNIYGNIPPQSPATAIEVLEKIATLARNLHDTLLELDMSTSEIPLLTKLGVLGRGPETIELFKQDLPLLYICADAASKIVAEPKSGRPTDDLERRFIASLGLSYKKHFARKPSHSRGTEFPRLVAASLEIALPGNPHAVLDNSKIVTAGLKEAGLLP